MSDVSYKALADATTRLRNSLALLNAHLDDELHVPMRDSVLLSFQFTYGLCRPMIERFLISDGDDPVKVKEMSLATIIRTANDRGLLRADWATWSGFRDARNQLAHVYSEPASEEVMVKVPAFLAEAQHLYKQLMERSAQQ